MPTQPRCRRSMPAARPLLAVLILALLGASPAQEINEALRAELLERMERDQQVRKLDIQSMSNEERMKAVGEFMKVDRENTAWLKALVGRIGWPTPALVGEDGAHAAWLLVQHADLDPAFQAECLPLLRAAAERGGPLRVVEDQIGRPTWTGALARAILQALECGARGTLHLACEGVASWFDLAVATVEEGVRRGRHASVEVEAVATELAEKLAAKPPGGLAATKSAIARFLGTEAIISSDGAAIDNVLSGRTEAYDSYVADKLKDTATCQHHPERFDRWLTIARQEIERVSS